MDQLETLRYSVGELQTAVGAIDDSMMDGATTCAPWTVRQLASHALNNQLLWAGVVTEQETVSVEATLSGEPVEGDLRPFAASVAEQALQLWETPAALADAHMTPFGELPGTVVINFPIFDALVHAWDISASVDRPYEFTPEAIDAVSVVVHSPFADGAREAGLIAAPTRAPGDATSTELLIAETGRSITRSP